MKHFAFVVVIEAESEREAASVADHVEIDATVFVGAPWEVEPSDDHDTVSLTGRDPWDGETC